MRSLSGAAEEMAGGVVRAKVGQGPTFGARPRDTAAKFGITPTLGARFCTCPLPACYDLSLKPLV
jgi:hypothetical protein